jgi:GMP synthase (glutamine-hydrolysing)
MNKVLILDFGSQYTQLIARKIRELGVYSEILPFNTPLAKLRKLAPSALVLSGGPQSVYEKSAPRPKTGIFELGVPVLGICYGLQIMAHCLGGEVLPSKKREYGFASLRTADRTGLLVNVRNREQVWMSHGDRLGKIPPGFRITASTVNTKAAAIENRERGWYGVQFHPEVIHTREGKKILANFLFRLAGLKPDWNMSSFISRKVREIRETVGSGKVICGLSGGVDSLVTSLIIHKAIGSSLTCIFIDNGLLRKGQYETLMEAFRHKFALKVIGIDASDLFLEKLRRVSAPERKRKTIGKLFIHLFDREATRLGGAEFLAQGTIYPDVIESNPVKGPSARIKAHHNVGGLPKGMAFKLIEPLRELFKDEVRALALELGVDAEFIHQHPFPGPGLAVRVIGLEEVRRAGLYKALWQAFAVLLPVRSVGVMGDQRTYQRVVAVRLVQSTDGMTANWYPASTKLLAAISTRIVNEVPGVNRVVYDITTKPPGTIEWE